MEKLLLVDGHSILSRAFFGVPNLTTGSGFPTNAVYGFMNILLKAVEDEHADHVCAAFDLDRSKLKRTQLYPQYKGTRKPMPQELHVQVSKAQELLKAMGIPVITMEGYEADDILGTLAKKAQAEGMEVTILSGDRDLLQLADEKIKISIPKTSKGHTEVYHYYPEDVKREYGVTPLQFIDVKALQGDTSDNIPGLPGVGEKTAREIIETYGSIENARAHADEVRPPRASRALSENFDLAELSKELATIDIHVPVPKDLCCFEKNNTADIYTNEALAILRELELKSLAARFSSACQKTTEAEKSGEPEFVTVTELTGAKEAIASIYKVPVIGMSLSVSELKDEPEQISLFDMADEKGPGSALLSVSDGIDTVVIRSGEKMPAKDILSLAEDLAENFAGTVSVIGLKGLMKDLPEIRKAKTFDPSVAAYLLNPLRDSYTYDTIAMDHLGMVLRPEKELLKKGESVSDIAQAFKAFAAASSVSVLREKLKDGQMEALYDTVEHPLIGHLCDMEIAGIRVDREALSKYSQYLKEKIGSLEEKIYKEAGEIFNINSPAQLGMILFEKLGIKGSKKTKTGYSTAADVLEKLAPEYEIVRDVLEYRGYGKLRSTYAEGLTSYISADNRIHGTFHQTVTATGRISSADPNLQNIPVRTEAGRKIREVFIPQEGFLFTDADYSQVELRILASLSGDEKLIGAYRDSVDIHTLTASEVFHVSPEEVTPEMRRNAKAVNFGIVYGISAFGLGEDLSISRKEATEYIDRYFETYPGVKEYLDRSVKEAKEKGYVKTMFGRIRPIPELRSSNYMERQFGERIAMNSPIQGTAADIMKIAMDKVAEDLMGMRSRLVLQVHDELLVETAPEEEEEVKRILRRDMETAADLSVQLKVDIKTGGNWNECH